MSATGASWRASAATERAYNGVAFYSKHAMVSAMRLRELEHELDAWTAEGLVSPEQAAAIRGRYAREAPAATRGRIVRVVSAVGAVVAGLGVVLFVAANWDGMPRPTRVVLLLALVAAAYGAGYVLRERRGTHPHVGEALYLLGGLAFAAEIFLVGQMYHVDAHWPLAFLAIALLTGAVAAVARAQALAALSLVALGVWPLTELLELDGDAGRTRPSPRRCTAARCTASGRAIAASLGRAGFRAPMRALGLPLLLVGTFVFTFAPAHEAVDDAAVDGRALSALVALAVAAGAGAVAARALPAGRRTAPWEAAGCSPSSFLVVLAVLAPAGTPDGGARLLSDPLQPAVRDPCARGRSRSATSRTSRRSSPPASWPSASTCWRGTSTSSGTSCRARSASSAPACCCSGSPGSSSGSGPARRERAMTRRRRARVRGARRGAGAAAAEPWSRGTSRRSPPGRA